MKTVRLILGYLSIFSLLSACGSGTGGSPPSGPSPTKVVLKVGTSSSILPAKRIYGLDFAVVIPAGVSLDSTVAPPELDAGTVLLAPNTVDSLFVSSCQTATGTSSGKARLTIMNVNGFDSGEIATINCKVLPGVFPNREEFTISNFLATDENGVTISGLNAGLTVDIQFAP